MFLLSRFILVLLNVVSLMLFPLLLENFINFAFEMDFDATYSEFPVIDDEEVKVSPDFNGYRKIADHGYYTLGVVRRYDHLFFVKSLRPDIERMHFFRLMLRKEFKIMISVSHPGIVSAFEMVSIPGVGLSILMEYVEGETLDVWLARGQEPALRRKVADTLIDALSALHAHGIVHRDLKPSNLMVNSSGVLKIIDFGLGDAPDSAVLKIPSGTRRYSPPEQFVAGSKSDSRSDVFSLGLMVKELHCGLPYRIAARRALLLNPDSRPADASAFARLVRKLRRIQRLGLMSVVAFTVVGFMFLLGVGLRGKPETASAGVSVGRFMPEETVEPIVGVPVSDNADEGKTVPVADSSLPVSEVIPPPVSGSDPELKMKIAEIDEILGDKASAIVQEMRLMVADPELSSQWRAYAASRMLSELDELYETNVSRLLRLQDAAGKPKYKQSDLDWNKFTASQKRETAIALRDSMAAAR